ncbi:MAG: F0F1 ATP synthase subunit A [Pseudomonadota bacterium]
MAASPVEQFEIKPIIPLELFGIDASFTNSALFMVIGAGGICAFLTFAMSRRSLVPSRAQSLAELSYEFIANMVRDNVGTAGMKFMPFVFSLFIFVLVLNLLGMIAIPAIWTPFTVTSHIAVTFALAALVFIVVTVLGFVRHGMGFFRLFVPEGVPIAILPMIVVIELISYLIRPITLSVRLFANMLAGHIMMKVFAGFVVALGAAGVVPFVVMIGLTGFEILVALLQAFIFSILTCLYLNDAINLHDH